MRSDDDVAGDDCGDVDADVDWGLGASFASIGESCGSASLVIAVAVAG
ncbi:hypothetical protein RMSM_06312 [Rhodopirellula maiorica SM1]|uniref:Uncharacterized protein n=1 Tax=Rhodopirellula maiorica SM1 TaxID=1265738 RepID=M5RBA1_9BACT|nr:hypothetical protein RMSM_06312 [Rhodopirellula maiorica SM1]